MVTTSGVQRDPPKDLAGVLDESANTLFMTELVRGMMLTLKAFFDKKYTVRPQACPGLLKQACSVFCCRLCWSPRLTGGVVADQLPL